MGIEDETHRQRVEETLKNQLDPNLLQYGNWKEMLWGRLTEIFDLDPSQKKYWETPGPNLPLLKTLKRFIEESDFKRIVTSLEAIQTIVSNTVENLHIWEELGENFDSRIKDEEIPNELDSFLDEKDSDDSL